LARDGGAALDATGTYLGDVFIRGNLDATASWSGGLFEMAAGVGLAKVGKAGKAGKVDGGSGSPKLTGEPKGGPLTTACRCCFAGGTLVVTQSGLRPIEDIAEGELVASRDEETGEIAWKPVTALFVFDDDRITYLLTLVDDEGREQSFEVTDNHPFYVEGEGWVDSIDLKPGMRVPRYEGGFLTVVSITSLNRSPVTYNFEVEGFHTYFVGEQGAWVHNACACDIGGGQTVKLGGRHRETTKPTNDGMDSHHTPAKASYKEKELNVKDGPSIKMKPEDHRKTASHPSQPGYKEYIARQKQLIDEGKVDEAITMDIDDIQSKFGQEYDEHILQMIDGLDGDVYRGLGVNQ
jgi:hypothetical protein